LIVIILPNYVNIATFAEDLMGIFKMYIKNSWNLLYGTILWVS